MKKETISLPGIRISKELHKRIKYHALMADQTQQDYIDSIVPPLPAAVQARTKDKH